jgi:O-antigen biosynthesis protein
MRRLKMLGYLAGRLFETLREGQLRYAWSLLAWRIERKFRYRQPFLDRGTRREPLDLDAQYQASLPRQQSPVRIEAERAVPGTHQLLVLRDAALRPGAAGRFASAAVGADLVYADEDHQADGRRVRPLLKPAYSPELHLASNYLGDVLLVSRELLKKVESAVPPGGVSPHDLALRLADAAQVVRRIPEVLSSRTVPEPDVSLAGVEAALTRRGRKGVVTRADDGTAAVRYPTPRASVAVVIPSAGQRALLEPCLAAIHRLSAGLEVETLVLDTRFDPRAQGEDLAPLADLPGVRVESWERQSFNYAAVNNEGARRTRSDYLLFLNDDTEPLDGRWLAAMLELAQWPETAAVGSLLLYPDRSIQHAGVILGVGGGGAHALRCLPLDVRPNQPWALRTREVSAVTGACMLVRRASFEAVGGFDESFSVDNNDLDLCLRLGARGGRVIFTPESRVLHRESATRRKWRKPAEERAFLDRWGVQLSRGDPYYSPCLTLVREDFSLRV